MADDSLYSEEPMRWNENDFPRSEYVERRCELTKHQEECAMIIGRISRRQDIRYLEAHPEIRAITTMLLNAICVNRPSANLPDFCTRFFSRPRDVIERDLKPFLPLGHEREREKPSLPSKRTSEDSTYAMFVRAAEMERSLLSADIIYEQESLERASPTTRSTVSAVCTEAGLYEEEEEDLQMIPSLESVSFASSVEMMLNDLKNSLDRMRMGLGLEDIPEERESISDIA